MHSTVDDDTHLCVRDIVIELFVDARCGGRLPGSRFGMQQQGLMLGYWWSAGAYVII